MPKRSSKRRANSQLEEEEERPRSRRSTQSSQEEEDDNAEEDVGGDQFMFSQQVPEMSQNVAPERPSDRRNVDGMDPAAREKALTSVSRLILMKALERQTIDRLKIPKEASIADYRISSVAFQEATDRLHNVFGFELKRIPKYLEEQKSTPKRFKDRHYVVNGASKDNDHGCAHSKAIHSAHQDAAMEKGFLMLTLALIFCKGESHADGSRWVLARDLYRLLHSMDDSIPEEPPQQGTARAKTVHQKSRLRSKNMTPNVDYLLEKFTQQDYLIKEKATEENYATQALEEGDMLYSMGPRSAMEVGRKQVIYFCAEILGEEPDP
eukprot:CAMPEP_0117085592 /NCGR_PEP_ID=MMETSP0472-20121206/60149_1 /TAXON_ID=693140 ORGANISM="Tiarina fusus, Strain LIS" /NCGR_SAMPLE_ID=MMETSP0472 /ASSEMBLY_ACC=CAM_ASM_000603 /LENGTH=322 /DNA_ID=CAMNT_0004814869 /DNA_START=81 /DNA_END=1045 /DNA_ORIENTATION=-